MFLSLQHCSCTLTGRRKQNRTTPEAQRRVSRASLQREKKKKVNCTACNIKTGRRHVSGVPIYLGRQRFQTRINISDRKLLVPTSLDRARLQKKSGKGSFRPALVRHSQKKSRTRCATCISRIATIYCTIYIMPSSIESKK